MRKISKLAWIKIYAQFSRQNENLFNNIQNLMKNRNWTFPIGHYFTWKLELASDILWMIIVKKIGKKLTIIIFVVIAGHTKYDLTLKTSLKFYLKCLETGEKNLTIWQVAPYLNLLRFFIRWLKPKVTFVYISEIRWPQANRSKAYFLFA